MTMFGVLLLVGGFTVLAVVRPWQSDDRARKEEVEPPVTGGFRSTRPRPGPRRAATVTGAAMVSGAATVTGAALVSGAATVSGAAMVSGGASVSGATTLRGGAVVSGAATVSGGAAAAGGAVARRPRPVRGGGAGVPGAAAAGAVPETLTAVIPRLAPAPTAAAGTRTRVFEAPAGVSPAARPEPAGPARRGGPTPTGGPSPVVPLKPRPAARRAEPGADRVPVRHHRVETIQRGRRVSTEPGDTEIVLPEWLGPMSVPDDATPVRARHAG
ncbi:hypothetical protein AB0B31_23480 [Catellatospora citrea]|uniref:hypothetical protein n=1 Tax=Catellatospora citrea TaxID=53366 RepID=UPI0033ECA826